MNIEKEIVIIGGGPAGMAAALGAPEQGVACLLYTSDAADER